MVIKNTIITQGGYKLPKKSLSEAQIIDIKKNVIAKPELGDYVETEEYPIYIETEDNYYVPRYYGVNKYGNTILDTAFIKPTAFKFTGNLRDYQLNIVDICYNHLIKKHGGILSVPCGRGKTTMALYLASKLKLKTLILVHKSFLLDQWTDRIKQFTDAKIGTIRQNNVITQDMDIVVGMIQSISMKDYDLSIFKDFGCVIVDETHHIVSKIFSKALYKLNTMYTIGLTATPKRADGLTYLLNWFLGDIMYKEDKRINKKVAVKILNYKSSYVDLFTEKKRWFKGKTTPDFIKMISNIIALKKRNTVILNIIKEIIKQNADRKILVLSARISHLKKLKKKTDEYITENNLSDEIKTYFYIGACKQKDRELAEKQGDIIFASYDMAQEGLDIERLNTLILATAKKDVEQAVGRIMRKVCTDDDIRPLIIDIKDHLSIFKTHGSKREDLYFKNKYQINHYYIKDMTMISKDDFRSDAEDPIETNKLEKIILDIDYPMLHDEEELGENIVN